MKYSKQELESAKQVEKRKVEHIKIQLENDIEYRKKTTLLEDVILLHNALPEINRDQVDTTTTFLDHLFKAPLMVAAITGGSKQSEKINKSIAKACQKLGLGMGFGSMKAMIVNPSLAYSYQVRDVAPDIFLAGNIGANDLAHFSPKVLKETLKIIGADILAIHLNPAQELVQKEGQAYYHGLYDLIAKCANEMPVYVKETGQGISGAVAKKLSTLPIKAIDVAGAGGTSWTAIEYVRKGENSGLFWDWGIPTAFSVIQTRNNTSLPIIATGGLRTGEDIAKALILGADIGAMALPLLKEANISDEQTEKFLAERIHELGDVLFLLGAENIQSLKEIQPIIVGKLQELLSAK